MRQSTWRVTALVLAAGSSRRMGRPKALLPSGAGGETFVARAVRILREGGAADVAVVLRAEDEPLRTAVRGLSPPPRIVINPSPERGQLSSLIAGIEDAGSRGAAAVLVLPVDMPRVQASSVATLLTAAGHTRAPIVRAVHKGRHGHPVLFRRAVFEALRIADPAIGAKAVLRGGQYAICDVDVDDPGILRDVDHPAEYDQLLREEP